MAATVVQGEYDGKTGPVPINGIKVENGAPIPARKELRDMKRNSPDQWNLYLLGLERFKQVEENEPLSFFQIAGIHGLPHKRWPDAGWSPLNEDGNAGFCTHSSILFLPWHRPYLALFEAELYKHVNRLAKDLEKEYGDRYVKAAKDFRIPYWDWALPASGGLGLFPEEALRSTKPNLIRPKETMGKSAAVKEDNPLAYYTFGKVAKSVGDPKDYLSTVTREKPTTVRYQLYDNPTLEPKMKPDPIKTFETSDRDFSNWTPETKAYQKGWNLTERTVYVLKAYKAFAPMSHNLFYEKQKDFLNFGSLEDSHNSIHGYVGKGSGHMGDPSVAAFDPIFWCHHTNIDRLFAIWQALNDKPEDPSTYVTPGHPRGDPTFLEPDTEGPETPLAPFTKNEKAEEYLQNFWRSKEVRYTKTFGYVYPETVEEDPAAVWAALDKLYPTGSAIALLNKPKPALKASTAELAPLAKSHRMVAEKTIDTKIIVAAVKEGDSKALQTIASASEATKVQLPKDRSLEDIVKDRKYLEWLVNVKAVKHSLGGDYFVHVFIGDPDDNIAESYLTNPTHVATFSTFGQDPSTGCGKCQKAQVNRAEVTGQIPLTIALLERYLAGHVHGLGPEDVVPFLQTHLHWRVTNHEGTILNRRDVEGLLVGVVSNEVTLPTGPNELPRYSPSVVAWESITMNQSDGPRGDGTGYTGGPVAAAT